MRYDVLVVGAGHNGLATAGLLARKGRKVLVLERRTVVGGLAAAEEFYPGYRSAGLLHETTGLRPQVVEKLALRRHGLSLRREGPAVLALGEGGQGLLLSGDRGRAMAAIGRLSEKDAESYGRYHAFIDRVCDIFTGFYDEPPVDLTRVDGRGAWDLMRRALRLRRLGGARMLELLRLPPMPMADWLDEWFETDLLKAALALPAIGGTFLGPRSPGSNANLLLRECTAGPGVEGGGPALIAALERAARSFGAEIRTGAAVERVLADPGSVKGVQLAGGERIEARVVAASCDPKHLFLDLLPPGAIAHRLEHRIRKFRARGTTAQLLLALAAPVRFACRPEADGIAFARAASSLTHLERAFDAVKYRAFSDAPALDIHVPTVETPGLAPAGHSVLSALIHFAPHDLRAGWDEAQKERLGDRVVEILESHAPGLKSAIVSGQLLSPRDLEERYGITGGHIHHGEHSLDQLLIRPAPECAEYRTPVPGLFLCGSGSHPGGGLTCGPGALAAASILAAGR